MLCYNKNFIPSWGFTMIYQTWLELETPDLQTGGQVADHFWMVFCGGAIWGGSDKHGIPPILVWIPNKSRVFDCDPNRGGQTICGVPFGFSLIRPQKDTLQSHISMKKNKHQHPQHHQHHLDLRGFRWLRSS